MSKIYVIHENSEWLPPFAEAFDVEGVAWEEWYLVEGALDLDSVPPEGVFYSRMSASSHTRGHVASKDYTRSVLSWLEIYCSVVVNGRRVVQRLCRSDRSCHGAPERRTRKPVPYALAINPWNTAQLVPKKKFD